MPSVQAVPLPGISSRLIAAHEPRHDQEEEDDERGPADHLGATSNRMPSHAATMRRKARSSRSMASDPSPVGPHVLAVGIAVAYDAVAVPARNPWIYGVTALAEAPSHSVSNESATAVLAMGDGL